MECARPRTTPPGAIMYCLSRLAGKGVETFGCKRPMRPGPLNAAANLSKINLAPASAALTATAPKADGESGWQKTVAADGGKRIKELTFRERDSGKEKFPPPSIFAKPFACGNEREAIQLLTPGEQEELLEISRIAEFRRNTVIYPEGGKTSFIYNVISGVAETYHLLPGGERHITTFLFPSDLLGLSENGRYVATAQALTPMIAYKIPFDSMDRLIRRDPALDVVLLCKLCDELRQSERHALITAKHDARARVAAFILWLRQRTLPERTNEDSVTLPMLRHDIADYLGLTMESVSRALSQLEAARLIRRQGPRTLLLLDLSGLQKAADQR